MTKTLFGIGIAIVLGLAGLSGCAGLASSSGQSAAAPVVHATRGKAVIYVVRTDPDTSYLTAPLLLDGQPIGATFAGTHMRLELAPGRHRLGGAGSDNASISLDVAADRVYFLQHSVAGSWRATNPQSFFTLLDDRRGRAALARAPERAGDGA